MGARIALLATLILTIVAPLHTRAETDPFTRTRKAMVDQQIRVRGIDDRRVLAAMETVARHLFVPEKLQSRAYADSPLPIGEGQTISQPYIVALMSTELSLGGNERVLEIGTGSGYQAAILSHLAAEVYSMEIKPVLHRQTSRLLKSLGYANVETTGADGYFGWPAKAPFDAIMITAAVNHIPPPLLEQLKEGGRLILPLGNPFGYQNLALVTKQGDDFTVKQITGVLFVPLTGHALKQSAKTP